MKIGKKKKTVHTLKKIKKIQQYKGENRTSFPYMVSTLAQVLYEVNLNGAHTECLR